MVSEGVESSKAETPGGELARSAKLREYTMQLKTSSFIKVDL